MVRPAGKGCKLPCCVDNIDQRTPCTARLIRIMHYILVLLMHQSLYDLSVVYRDMELSSCDPDKQSVFGFSVLRCLMTPGLSKDIWCHV